MSGPATNNVLTIDGLGPLPLRQPESVAEVAAIVREAAASHQAIYPVAGRTMLGFGLSPNKAGVAVDLRKLNQVIDYPARDMTITVQAGITVHRLQEVLAGEGQRLPVDVPLPDQSTLGGAIACNLSGPRRYALGTLRDYVIGISVINFEGHEVKAGGRVVKNVAGYDMCKLYNGALGTLGIISQVTLKVTPTPETLALLKLKCPDEKLEQLLDAVHASRTRPAAVALMSPRGAGPLGPADDVRRGRDYLWWLVVGYEGSRQAVLWQVDHLQKEIDGLGIGPAYEVDKADMSAVWSHLTDFPLSPPASVTFKANVLPSRVVDFCRLAEPVTCGLIAHTGNGIVIGHFPAQVSLELIHGMIPRLQAKAVELQGNLVLLRCPTDWKRSLKVWGVPRGDRWLMREVKAKLDPQNLFNPGRLLEEA